MATASIQWFRINSTGRYWSARFDYADTTPGPLQVWNPSNTITISGGASALTAACHHTKIETIDSKTCVFASGTFSRKVTWADGANLLATAASAIFTEVGGSNSAATFADFAVENNACEDADGNFAIPDPTGVIGIRGFAAVDPSTLTTDLFGYIDPDQETLNDDDVVNPILDQSGNGNNVLPRSDVAGRRPTFTNDYFGSGKHAYSTNLFGGVLWGTHDFDTANICVIGIMAPKDAVSTAGPQLGRVGSVGFQRTLGNTDGFTTGNNADREYALNEPILYAWEFNTSDNTARRWLYGYKTGWTATAWTGSATLNLFFDTVGNQKMYFGKTYIWSSSSGLPLTEAQIKGCMSWLMNDYSVKPRTIHVASTGSDSTGTGSSAAPYRSLSKALGVVRHGVGEHINLTYGDAYGSNTDAAFTSTKGDLDDLEGIDAHNRSWVKATGTRSNGRCVIKRTVGTLFINDAGDAIFTGLHGVKVQQPDNDVDDAAYDAGGDAGGAISLGSGAAGTHINAVLNDLHVAGAHDGITAQVYDTSPFDADAYNSVFDCSRIQTTSIFRVSERASGIYTNGLGCEFYDEIQHFTPGWIPTTDPSDTLSHGQYHNYKGKGSIIIGHSLAYNASAHGFMLRAGGWTPNCYTADCPIGITGDQRTLKINQCVFENGRDIDGADRGWAIWTGNGDWQDINENVVIPGDGYTGDFAIRVGSTGFASQPAQSYYASSASWRIDINRNTVAGFPTYALQIDNEEGADIDSLNFGRNLFAQGSQFLIQSLLDQTELDAITITADYNCRSSSQGSPSEIDGVAKTEAEMVTALGETNFASTVPTFSATTRKLSAWLTMLEGSAKVTADCKAVLIAAHADGWDDRYSVASLNRWVARGYKPTNLDAANFNNDTVGAVDWTDNDIWPLKPATPTDPIVVFAGSQVAVCSATESATSGITRYRVYQGTVSGSLTLAADSDDDAFLYIDNGSVVYEPTGLTPGATYYVTFVAVDGDGVESEPTSEISFTTQVVVPVDDSDNRLYITGGAFIAGAGADWTDAGNVTGADSGDWATSSPSSQMCDLLYGDIAATDYAETVIAWKIGVTIWSNGAPHSSAQGELAIGSFLDEVPGFPAKVVYPTSTKTECEFYYPPSQTSAITALVAAGMSGTSGGFPVGPQLDARSTGGATEFRVAAMWLQPVFQGSSGGIVGGTGATGKAKSLLVGLVHP